MAAEETPAGGGVKGAVFDEFEVGAVVVANGFESFDAGAGLDSVEGTDDDTVWAVEGSGEGVISTTLLSGFEAYVCIALDSTRR